MLIYLFVPNREMNMEQFSLLLAGIICLIILYSMIGNFLEHRKVTLKLVRYLFG